MDNMKITPGRLAAPAVVLAVAIFFAATGIANAGSPPPLCSNQIIACGCTIAAPGNYTVENDLDAAQGLTLKGGCIDITGQNITLQVNHHIFGPGSPDCMTSNPKRNAGIGIHVFSTAARVSIFVPVSCGWNYGAESEGEEISWDESASLYDNVGFLFNNATSSSCTTCAAESDITGIEIAGGSGNSFTGGIVEANSQYGFWLNGTQNNTFSAIDSLVNGIAGFYLGCSSTGNVKPSIPCTTTPTTGNSLSSSFAALNSKYGIAVEKGSIYNQFLDNQAAMDTKVDIIDGNGNCIYNQYSTDVFTTKSPKCIE